MKILFLARHYSYLRMFESAIAALASRGHIVVLAADREEALGGREMVEALAAKFPNVRLTATPRRHSGLRSEVARQIRLGIDYLRFLQPRYEGTPHLRARARERAPAVVVRLAELPLLRRMAVRSVSATLRLLERGLPVAPAVEAFLREEAPDVLMITPLVDIGSPQLEYLAAARKVGIRTVLPVGSWDHLSSKSLLRDVPQRLLVWNDVQRAEAVEMHGVSSDRVIVTGAQCYDQWFDRAPARSRAAFCARVGLRPDRPFILYVCSSLFRGTAAEPTFVREWVRAIRTSNDTRVREMGILVRPHPGRLDEWSDVDLSEYPNLARWGGHPVNDEAKDDYFDSMYYSAAVVGLNTSAFIEAAVVGRPVHTVLLPHISRDNQEGTLHFRYLLDVNGGLLHAARNFEEHVGMLAASCAAPGQRDPKAERFVSGFVRPFGRRDAATPRFADAVEGALTLPAPSPVRATLSVYVARVFLAPILYTLFLASPTLRARTNERAWKRAKRFSRERLSRSKRPRTAEAGD